MTEPTTFVHLVRTAGAVLLVAGSLAACKQAPPPPEPIRAVKVMEVGSGSFGSAVEYAGEVKARVESRLGFRVAGKITHRQAEVGQHVQPGAVLAQLDPKDYQLAAEAARAQSNAALTNRDLAAADLKRYQGLRAQNFISEAELQRRESTFKSAQAQFEQAQAQVASQGNQARYTNLVADVAGIVTAVEAEPGQVVSAGTPVVRIANDGARDVVFAVPEDRASLVKPGSPVSIRSWADNGQPMEGTVREVAAAADAVTRTYTVKVAVDAASAPPLGATVYAQPKALSHVGTPVIKLPTSALRREGQGTAVWVLDKTSMTVRSQPVQVATADGNEAVIAAGVTPGMLVVSAGVHVLSPGQKVSIYHDKYSKPEPATAATPQAAPAGTASAATQR
ncbi:efflux RND transporter periplasmic adaptor subunit [Variovorax sp. OV329]|uniref:efflux RND transporter periplasmic adaptor subunit n=1 Tax=Variovorax sp. OV329 TaxID=1882825 RepID=UPI0008ED437B|nr:efflux RND transporter periplasmic adaptor subunit [Variovorax sp. OV329]SFM47258.1 RND family efflux transporter, MFP subunit [Variovorax sp. OV329]